jgi:cbb3-type cytochrome oxidase maturation protein
MEALFILLPIVLILAVIGVLTFLWALKDGQMDDMDTPAVRILFEEESERVKHEDSFE